MPLGQALLFAVLRANTLSSHAGQAGNIAEEHPLMSRLLVLLPHNDGLVHPSSVVCLMALASENRQFVTVRVDNDGSSFRATLQSQLNLRSGPESADRVVDGGTVALGRHVPTCEVKKGQLILIFFLVLCHFHDYIHSFNQIPKHFLTQHLQASLQFRPLPKLNLQYKIKTFG
jgi:hypothetical protein